MASELGKYPFKSLSTGLPFTPRGHVGSITGKVIFEYVKGRSLKTNQDMDKFLNESL